MSLNSFAASSCKHIFSEWKTVWILISWLHEKPADLELQCFQKRIHQGPAGQGFSQQVRPRG